MSKKKMTRREWLRTGLRGGCLVGLTALSGRLLLNGPAEASVWQIDPALCTACGKCATSCVRHQSAARCFQAYSICGYCDLCSGYFEPDHLARNEGAENQLCPTGALVRKLVEPPYFEYSISRDDCIGCGRCVEFCKAYGNGSFYLQISQDICKQCNECSIARACPARAISRYHGKEDPQCKNG